MLRTGGFTLAAADAIARFGCGQGEVIIIYALIGHGCGIAQSGIVQGEKLRNGNVFGAAVGAVATAGAGCGGVGVYQLPSLEDQRLLLLIQGTEGEKTDRLSAICSRAFMPGSTTPTPS